MLPKIGIIILTYPTKNWERDINRLFQSLERLNYPKDRAELICVESKGNLPPVKPWFDERWMPKSGTTLPKITYIFRDQWIGFSGNNNLGLAKAKELGCDYVHLTNEDTDVDPDYILHAVERAERDPNVAIVQSLLLLGDGRERVNSVGNAFHYLGFGYSNGYRWTRAEAETFFVQERKWNPDLEIGYSSGAGMLVKLSALDTPMLFDEGLFSYHEDTDICLRARLRGFKVVIEPSSVIWHYYEFAKSQMNYYWMERNRYALIFSYYRAWTLAVLFPMMVVMDLGILLFSFKSGWWKMKMKVYRDFCSPAFWRWIGGRRKNLRAVRRLSDRAFLAQAVSTIAFQDEGVKNPILTYVGNPLLRTYWWLAKRII